MSVDSGHMISMKLPIMSKMKVCLPSSSSKRIFGDTTTLHMPVPRRIHKIPTLLEHERASAERPLRGVGFGNSVTVEDDDHDTLPAGHSSPIIAKSPVMTASSSTNLGSHFSHPLDAYKHLSGSPLSQSSFPIYPNHSRSPVPAQAQRTPVIPVQGALPPAPAATTTCDTSPTRQSPANRFNFMGAPLVQSPISWTQDHAHWRPEKPWHVGNPPAPTLTTRQDRAFTQQGDPIGSMDLDMPHPVRAWSRRRAGSHRELPARPEGESHSSVGMFTNAQVKEISGGIFHNVAHIYESDSPAPGGGLAFQFAALSLQAVFFALLSFLLPNTSTILTGSPINQPPHTATPIPLPLRDVDYHPSTHVMAPRQDVDPVEDR